jgi:TonB family protein
MSVTALDKVQRLTIVPVPTSDNLLFSGYLAAAFLGNVYAQGLTKGWDVVPLYFFVGFIFAGLSLVALEIIARLKLGKLKASPLPVNVATDAFRRVLERESERVGLAKRNSLSVFWIPTDWRLGARVLGGLSRKLVLSGSACVAIAKEDTAALFVLRHELAHIKNRDTRLYLVVVNTCLTPFALTVALLDFNSYPKLVMMAVNSVIVILVTIFLLYRREYLADAVAANSGPAGNEYLDFLAQASHNERGWFHPSPTRRMKALVIKSPVLSPSVPFILLCVIAAWGAQFQLLLTNYTTPYRGRLPDYFSLRSLMFAIVIVMILAIFFEVAKDYRQKIPANHALSLPSSVDKRWIPAFCAINGFWWAMATAHRFIDREGFVKRGGSSWSWDFGTCVCVIIAMLWFWVALGLLRYERWAKIAGIALGVASVVGHIYEFLHKQDLRWFGWYFGEMPSEFRMLTILIITGGSIVVGLFSKNATPIVYQRRESRLAWVQIALAPVLMLLLTVALVIFPELLPIQAAHRQIQNVGPLDASPGNATDQISGNSEESTEIENQKILDVPSSVMEGRLITRVEPIYPADARQAGIKGPVTLRVTVSREGSVQDVVLVKGRVELATAAIEAVKQWRYKPLLLNGENQIVSTEITILFQ